MTSSTNGVRYFPVGSTAGSPDGVAHGTGPGSGPGQTLDEALEAALGAADPAGAAKPLIGMIWAQTLDGVIGRDGGMPWHLPEDLAHFKNTTAGHPVIMGRRTWESFPPAYRPLPGRTNIVVSSSDTLAAEISPAGAVVVPSLEQALETARTSPGGDLIWIVGGAQLYQAAEPLADAAVVTVIESSIHGDTYAPHLGTDWTFSAASPAADWHTAANGTSYRIALWTRNRGSEIDVTNQPGNVLLP